MKILFLSCALFCCLISAPAYAAEMRDARAQGPEQALKAVQSALDNGDVALFERHVDIDALVANAVEFFLQEAQSPEGKARLSPVIAMLLSSVSYSDDAKLKVQALMGREARNFIVYGVQSGSFAGKKKDTVPPPDGLLAPLFADASLGRKEIRHSGKAVTDGKDRSLFFTVHDYGNGQNYPVVGRFRQVNNAWRLVQLDNLPALAAQIRGEAVEQQ